MQEVDAVGGFRGCMQRVDARCGYRRCMQGVDAGGTPFSKRLHYLREPVAEKSGETLPGAIWGTSAPKLPKSWGPPDFPGRAHQWVRAVAAAAPDKRRVLGPLPAQGAF